jgi:hypothetical protein
MMCARRWEFAARTVEASRFVATLVRHSSTNASSVIPDFGGNCTAAFILSKYGWNFTHAARSDNFETGPSLTVRRDL